MKEKLIKLEGLERDNQYMYFLDKDGDVARTIRAKGKGDKDKPKVQEKVAIAGVTKEKGFLYYIKGFEDGEYICRSEMKHGSKK